MLVFVGALWGAIVFPVISSCYWDRVTNTAFISAVLGGLGLFCVVRFELLPLTGMIGGFFEIVAGIGGGVVLGLMAFGFLGRVVGIAVAIIGAVICCFYFIDFLRDYTVLLGSLTAYGVSTVICVAISLASNERFDFDLIGRRVTSFQDDVEQRETKPGKEQPAAV
jgi:ABC-type antimicrobial peptide transport system permease subunit